MTASRPAYFAQLERQLVGELGDATAVLVALTTLLLDPASYTRAKGQPARGLEGWANWLVLTDRLLQERISALGSPYERFRNGSKWGVAWRGAREISPKSGFDFDVCVSFAGSERPIAERFAGSLTAPPIERRVFYDEFEKQTLWGEELFSYLHGVYSERSLFCVILFSHRYRQRAWTRHELRAAQTRVLNDRQPYMFPVEIDEGSIPAEFASVGYWAFAPGDEAELAEALEKKIDAYIRENYFLIEELTTSVNQQTVADAVVVLFREAITDLRARKDYARAASLATVALIAVADCEHLRPEVRALVDLVLFSAGAVGDLFDAGDSLVVQGSASVRRWIGSQGPLLFSREGWEEPISARFDQVNRALGDAASSSPEG